MKRIQGLLLAPALVPGILFSYWGGQKVGGLVGAVWQRMREKSLGNAK
jgi:hypothetical protein